MSQHASQVQPHAFGGTLVPAALLGLQGIHLRGKFGRAYYLLQVAEPPAGQLRPVAQVQVLGERIGPPATGLRDAALAPHAARAVEVDEVPQLVAPDLLHAEVRVEPEGLQAGQQVPLAVQVPPAGLHHADAGVREPGDGPAQEVRVRQEVRVEDGDQSPLRTGRPECQGTGLVPGAFTAAQVHDVHAPFPPEGTPGRCEVHGLIVAVVQHLHFQPVKRPVESAHPVDQPLHDMALIEHGQLNGHPGKHRQRRFRFRRASLPPQVGHGQVQLAQAEEQDEAQQQPVHHQHHHAHRSAVLENGGDDLVPGHDRAFHGAAHLAETDASAVVHGHLGVR